MASFPDFNCPDVVREVVSAHTHTHTHTHTPTHPEAQLQPTVCTLDTCWAECCRMLPRARVLRQQRSIGHVAMHRDRLTATPHSLSLHGQSRPKSCLEPTVKITVESCRALQGFRVRGSGFRV